MKLKKHFQTALADSEVVTSVNPETLSRDGTINERILKAELEYRGWAAKVWGGKKTIIVTPENINVIEKEGYTLEAI